MGSQILMVIGITLAAAIVAMLISGTASEMTLATTSHEDRADQHH